jgi:hypothetical protein
MKDIVFGYNDTFLATIAGIEEYLASKGKNVTIQSPLFNLQYNNSELARTKISQVSTGKVGVCVCVCLRSSHPPLLLLATAQSLNSAAVQLLGGEACLQLWVLEGMPQHARGPRVPPPGVCVCVCV